MMIGVEGGEKELKICFAAFTVGHFQFLSENTGMTSTKSIVFNLTCFIGYLGLKYIGKDQNHDNQSRGE